MNTEVGEALERLVREHRRKVAEVRADNSLSWEKKERTIRELGLEYDRERRHKLEIECIFAKVGEEVLTDLGILMEAHPENALADARTARKVYRSVGKVLEEQSETPIEGETGAWIVDVAAAQAVRMAARQDTGEEPDHDEVRVLAEALQARCPVSRRMPTWGMWIGGQDSS